MHVLMCKSGKSIHSISVLNPLSLDKKDFPKIVSFIKDIQFPNLKKIYMIGNGLETIEPLCRIQMKL